MKKLWYLILTYIWPRAFINVCVSKRGYETEDEIKNVKKQESERVKKIRKSHFINFILVTFLSVSGFFVANTINTHHPLELFSIRVFRLVSIMLYLYNERFLNYSIFNVLISYYNICRYNIKHYN